MRLPKALLETVAELLWAERGAFAGREFDRQRDAVDTAADVDDGRGVGVGKCERGRHVACAIDEQSYRARLQRVGSARPVGRDIEHADGVNVLARRPQWFARGRQDAYARTGAQNRGGNLRCSADDLLAIIEDEQHLSIAQRADDRGGNGFLTVDAQRERRRDFVGNGVARDDRRQIDQPDAVAEAVQGVGSERERHPCLPDAAGARECQQRTRREWLAQCLEIAFASDEAGQRDRQIVGTRVEGAQRRKIRCEIRRDQRVDHFGAAEIPQAMRAE